MLTDITHYKALPVGTVLDGKYEILSILGSGSFGITYLARFVKLESQVVIKEYFPNELAHRDSSSTVIPTSSSLHNYYAKGKEKFLFEAQTIAKFKHPYIVRVIDYFEENNTAYFVMEYEQGETLGEWLVSHPHPSQETIFSLIVPILEALSEIHSQHIYHRDIKPDNIYIREGAVPMLIDFGAAKQSYQEGSKASSFNPQTAGYAAPEQKASIAKYIGPHTDIYAVGAVLHKVVTGHTPPTADDRSISRDNEGADSYTPLASQNIGGYSSKFLSHIDWALSFLSRDRPQSAREFQQSLMGVDIPKPKKPSKQAEVKKPQSQHI